MIIDQNLQLFLNLQNEKSFQYILSICYQMYIIGYEKN